VKVKRLALKRKKPVVWISVAIAGTILAALLLIRLHHWRPRSLVIQGAVIRSDDDVRKESPISGASITASDGVTTRSTQSDASGYFNITFPETVWPGQVLHLTFQRDEYHPLELQLHTGLRLASKALHVAALVPIEAREIPSPKKQLGVVSNIRVRYTVNSQTEENVGSAVRTFQVVNKPNVLCNAQAPCSPDGNWKASSGSVTLDAGPENQFRNARASCIAGPCPFTRIDSSGFVNGGRTITASAVDWSNTATFLLEAEVFRTAMSSRVRMLYPVAFGQSLHFTLPPTEEGVSVEADVDGVPMVFPLGPDLYLSWATCTVRNNSEPEKTAVYRCELKPGYQF
jgi:hypothetical protein